MKKARFRIDTATLRAGSQGPATADIALLLGGEAFPMERWNDFVVVILCAWATAAVRLLRKEKAVEKVYFMDGPYLVTIKATRDNFWILELIEHRASPTEIDSGKVPVFPLLESLISACDSILSACSEAKLESRDTEELARAVADLKQEVSTMKN